MSRTNAFATWGGSFNSWRTMRDVFRRSRNRLRTLAVVGLKALREPRRLISGRLIAGRQGRTGSATSAGMRTKVNIATLDAAQCRALAQQYKDRAREPDVSQARAFIMKNIARSLMGLATQLDT